MDEKYRLENHTAADLDEMLTKVGELYTKDELDELIAAKQDVLTFDSAPTSGSENPVTSGGAYTALGAKVDKETGKGLSTNDYTAEDKAAVNDWKNGYIYQTASGTSTKTITLDPSSAYFVFITFGSWANFFFLNSTTNRAYIKQIVDQMSGDITTSYDGLSATFQSTAGNAFTLFARKLN